MVTLFRILLCYNDANHFISYHFMTNKAIRYTYNGNQAVIERGENMNVMNASRVSEPISYTDIKTTLDNAILKFSPAVKKIEDHAGHRFLLLNCNKERLEHYPVFKRNERDVLVFNHGISELDFHQLFPKKRADQYMQFFRRNGYFQPLQDGITFADNIRQTYDNHHRSNYHRIQQDIKEKLLCYRKDSSKPWSSYEVPQDIANVEVSLLITDLCNLSCRYCHVIDNTEESLPHTAPKIMEVDVLQSFAQQFIAYIKERFIYGCLTVCFFGGQPALKGKVRQFLYAAADDLSKIGAQEEIYIRFAIDDNGTQVDDELIAFYNKYNIQVNLSYDAPRDVNSVQRPFPTSSRKSGYVVEQNLKKLLDNQVDVGVRATVSHLNQRRILEAVKTYVKWGLRAAAFVPMQDIAHGKKVKKIYSPHPEILKNEFIRTFDYILELFETEHILFEFGPIASLLHSISLGGVIQPCGMGDVYYAVNPDGDVFTCHRDLIEEHFVCHVHDKAFLHKMNALSEDKKCSTFYSLLNPETLCSDQQCSCKEHTSYSCSNCEVLMFCGGSCPAASIAQYACVNWGVSTLLDSDPALGEDRCRFSKGLITHFLWQYIDADSDSILKKYVRALYGGHAS